MQQSEDEVMQNMMVKMTLSINKQCFNECVKDFGADKLAANEINCITSCAKRHTGAFTAMNDIQGAIVGKQTGGNGMF